MKKIIHVFLLVVLLVGCSKNTVQLKPQNVKDILHEASSSPSQIINTNEEAIFVCIKGNVKNVEPETHSFIMYDSKNNSAKIQCVVSDTRFDAELFKITDESFLTCTGKVMKKSDQLYFVVTDLKQP